MKTESGSNRIKLVPPDKVMILLVMALLAVGLLFIFSSSSITAAMSSASNNDPYFYLKRQAGWMLGGLVAGLFGMLISMKVLRAYTGFLYVASLISLVLVFTGFGDSAGGATRWLEFGEIRFAPSEPAKIVLVLVLANFMGAKGKLLKSFRYGVLPCLIISGLMIGLIYMQPDLGTAIVLGGTVYIMLIAGGARFVHLFLLLVAGLGAVALGIYVAPYRMERFISFLDPWAYADKEGFQVIQSLYALGSGGWSGVGLGESMQKLFHLPAQHTDFIFSIIGEEWGFIRTTLVILAFLLFVWRGLKIAWEAPNVYMGMVAVGITGIIGLQAAVNIGVTVGAMPVTGITLPFISYGGSSLMFTMFAVGILLNVSRYKSKKLEV